MTPAIAKVRLDQLLTDRGLAPSRSRAQALILAGQVMVNGQRVVKAGTPIPVDAVIDLITPDHPWVSRGGLKLDHGLAHWPLDVTGKRCLDVGASTGGFTDVLLSRGAAAVVAVDAGTNQLAWKLRSDARVTVLEQTNARTLTLADIGGLVNCIVMDVSFISQKLILPQFPALLTPPGDVVALIKPQFEVGKGEVGSGGVVREPSLWAWTIREVTAAYEAQGFRLQGLLCSEPPGPEGNREFLLWVSQAGEPASLEPLLEAALERAQQL